MTTGTWDRHRGHSLGYDVVDTGFNYRMDEPRAALLTARMSSLGGLIDERRRLTRRYRAELADVEGVILPYEVDAVDLSSCYVMPIVLDDGALQAPLRELLKDRWKVQTSLLYQSIHEFTAYRDEGPFELPRSEQIARSQVTLPLFPGLSETDQDRVIEGVRDGLATLAEKETVR
jgi:dTDP-4-amino-4,6-dideoxygalactose transaminase